MKAAIIMGSTSDLSKVEPAIEILKGKGINVKVRCLSAHRASRQLTEFIEEINADGTAANVSGSARAEWVWTLEEENTLSLVRTFPQDKPGYEMKGRYIIRFLTEKKMCLFDIGLAYSLGGVAVTSYYKKMKQ